MDIIKTIFKPDFRKIADRIKRIYSLRRMSLLVIPDIYGEETKSHKFSFRQLAVYFSAYTILVVSFVSAVYMLTPLKYIFIEDAAAFDMRSREIQQLNKRVIFLARELESITAQNKKLKYAIILGDPALADSIEEKRDTSKHINPYGGDLYSAVSYLYERAAGEVLTESSEPDFFIRPIEGFVSRNFNTKRGHMGIDFAVKRGTPVYAAASGFVLFADYTARDGFMMLIMHKNEYVTVYKHCSSLSKKVRERVSQGEVIALSGNSGTNTTGPHLHFEIWHKGQTLDPQSFFITD